MLRNGNAFNASTWAVTILAMAVLSARADVFHMPAGQTSLDFVTVGDPGNGAYPIRVTGSVGYKYQIGTYEVTTSQYVGFLNAVAATDPYGLYNPNMDIDYYKLGCGIKRAQNTDGTYSYSVAGDWANRPVNYVTRTNAMRFVNWLTNGQQVGSEGPATTESGSYPLNGTDDPSLPAVRQTSARYVIPTMDEWFKAAYYDPNKPGGAGYWLYPTRSNALPSNVLSAVGTNNANYNHPVGLGPCRTSEVGAFAGSPGPWGTFDQGGNVWEWTDRTTPVGSPPAMGGSYESYNTPYSGLKDLSATWGTSYWSTSDPAVGFRVALVPEPVTLLFFLAGGVLVARGRKA
jgi:formylglycine-generating enzyme